MNDAQEQTGGKERMDPVRDRNELMFAEHVIRYQLAASVASGRILDVACGTGYGSNMLARSGSAVVGVDSAREAVQQSRDRAVGPVRFVRADAQALPFGAAVFDCVVSFETIEHVQRPEQMLEELKRVLAPGGLLVISSPNRGVYPEGNPFHVREFTATEFDGFLRDQFSNVELLAQDNWIASSVLSEALAAAEQVEEASRGEFSKCSGRGLNQSLYLIALCSDAPLPSVKPHAALARVSDNDFWLEEMRRRDVELETLHEVREQRQRAFEAEMADVQQVVELKESRIIEQERRLQSLEAGHNQVEAAVRSKDAELTQVLAERDHATQALAQIESSLSWRMLGLYRQVLARVPLASRVYGSARSAAGRLLHGQGPALDASAGDAEPPAALILPRFDDPVVSIVIPVHNQLAMTAACLGSILRNTHGIAYEVIVVDDASSDGTAEYCAGVRHLKVVTNESPQGFLRSTNAGARVARGSYLLLLNNDTEVRPEWLNALIAPALADPSVGLVGAKLLYPDLTLQEAGAIVWSDGTGWNYGRGRDPGAWQYNYRREVDYCSAACLLVRRTVFDQLGGFDDRYAPAYYEDTDLAFGARELGYKVMYQPSAEVIHHEGVSSGTDVSSGIKRFQQINHAKFVKKWSAQLSEQPAAGSNLTRARERSKRNRVLVIDATVPTHDQDSGSLRMNSVVQALVGKGFAVTFLPDNRDPRQPYTAQLQRQGVEVMYGDYDLAEWLRDVAPELKMCLASRPTVAWKYLAAVREYAPGARFVFDTVDLHHLREARRAEAEGKDWLNRLADGYRELELGLVRAADASIAVTELEKELLLKAHPEAAVHVVPNVHQVKAAGAPFDARKDLVFVGGFKHPPNQLAVQYLVEEILPLVAQQIPDIHLHVVGSYPSEEVLQLASPQVSVTGYVADLNPFLQGCRLSVAPLTYGAGLKGKVTQALSEGLPVVTTSIGAEGTSLVHGKDLLIADDAASFAAEIVRAYQDEQLWDRLARNGLEYARANYSPEALGELLEGLFDELKVAPLDD